MVLSRTRSSDRRSIGSGKSFTTQRRGTITRITKTPKGIITRTQPRQTKFSRGKPKTIASSFRPNIIKKVKSPQPKISSTPKQSIAFNRNINPLGALISAIETTSQRNAQRKELLKQARIRGEKRPETFSIDEIFGGFL